MPPRHTARVGGADGGRRAHRPRYGSQARTTDLGDDAGVTLVRDECAREQAKSAKFVHQVHVGVYKARGEPLCHQRHHHGGKRMPAPKEGRTFGGEPPQRGGDGFDEVGAGAMLAKRRDQVLAAGETANQPSWRQ